MRRFREKTHEGTCVRTAETPKHFDTSWGLCGVWLGLHAELTFRVIWIETQILLFHF